MRGAFFATFAFLLLFEYSAALAEINECLSTNNCDANANCQKLPGSYACTCKAGFRGPGTICTDIDECVESIHNCHANAVCLNKVGSFSCKCNEFFSGNGTSCIAVPCSNPATCDPNARCQPVPGSYFCTCLAGYRGDGKTCTDIDECVESIHNCHANAVCVNTVGSFSCKCNEFFSGNGTSCIAVPCSNPATCDPNAKCKPVPGSYSCHCLAGYSGDGKTCTDIDECVESIHNCHANAVCVNTVGSFSCKCNEFFSGNGTSCIAVPCSNPATCDPNAKCKPVPGSYFCTCLAGYRGDGKTCTDIDECAESINNCHPKAICQNTVGSFSCQCMEDYSGNGTFCSDLPKKCSKDCGLNAHCTSDNICSCNTGFAKHAKTEICTASCDQQVIKGNNFGKAYVTETVWSQKQCDNGRPIASITCTTNNATKTASFDVGTYTEAPCSVTLSSLFTKGVLDLNHLSIANQTALVRLLSTGLNLTVAEREHVTNYIDELSTTLNQVAENTLSNVVHTINTLANQSAVNSTSLVQSLQSITSLLTLPPDVNVTSFATEHVAVVVGRPSTHGNRFNDSFFAVNATAAHNKSRVQPVSVFIPAEAYEVANRTTTSPVQAYISIVQGAPNDSTASPWVASVNVGINTTIKDLVRPINITFADSKSEQVTPVPGKLEERHSRPVCVYSSKKEGLPSTKGVCLIKGTSTCRTNHLTSFSILMSHKKLPTDVSLSAVTLFGCSLSIAGLVATILAHLSARKIRNLRQTRIFLHLCTVLCLFYLVFVLGISRTRMQTLCSGLAILLQYLLLSSWFWMAIYSHCVYSLLAMTFERQSSGYQKVAYIVGYGAPLLIVAASIGYSSTIQDLSDDDGIQHKPIICNSTNNTGAIDTVHFLHVHYRAPNKCWVHGSPHTFGFVVPCGFLLFINLAIFVLLMKKLFARRIAMRDVTASRSYSREFAIAVTMVTVMGLSWIFGYLSLISTDITYNSIMAWLFALFSSLQGILIFALTAVRRAELRNIWYKPLQTGFSSFIRPVSKLGDRVVSRVRSKTSTYALSSKMSSSTEGIVSPSSCDNSLPGYANINNGDSVSFETSGTKVTIMKGKSEAFGTMKIKKHQEASAGSGKKLHFSTPMLTVKK